MAEQALKTMSSMHCFPLALTGDARFPVALAGDSHESAASLAWSQKPSAKRFDALLRGTVGSPGSIFFWSVFDTAKMLPGPMALKTAPKKRIR